MSSTFFSSLLLRTVLTHNLSSSSRSLVLFVIFKLINHARQHLKHSKNSFLLLCSQHTSNHTLLIFSSRELRRFFYVDFSLWVTHSNFFLFLFSSNDFLIIHFSSHNNPSRKCHRISNITQIDFSQIVLHSPSFILFLLFFFCAFLNWEKLSSSHGNRKTQALEESRKYLYIIFWCAV